MTVLNEGEFQKQRYYLEKYQIVRLPKTGMFRPYILIKSPKPTKKIYEYGEKTPINAKLLSSDAFITKVIESLSKISESFIDLGIRKENITVLITNIKGFFGLYYHRIGIMEVSYQIFAKTYEFIQEVIVHEIAHQIFKNLPKESQEFFQNWYIENVFTPTFKDYFKKDELETNVTIPEDEIDAILENVGRKENPAEYIKHYAKQVHSKFLNNFSDPKLETITNLFKKQFSQNRDLFVNPTKLKQFLRSMKFPMKKTSLVASYFRESLKNLAHKKGLTPSEYAASNPDELFADTVAYILTYPKKVSPELKKIIYKTLN